MKQRTTISLCALAVLALFVMTVHNRSEVGSSFRGLASNESNATASASKNAYVPVSVRQARNNAQFYHAFLTGSNDVVNLLVKQEKIPNENYTVSEWVSASYKNTSAGVYYNFAVDLVGPHSVHLVIRPLVFYSSVQKTYTLVSYTYSASNASQAASNSTASTANPTQAANSTQNASHASTGAQNNTNVYTAIRVSEVTNGTRAEAALLYGAQALIETLIVQDKLPLADPQYRVSHLASAAYENITNGVRYEFKANLTNALNYRVDSTLVVDYSSVHKDYSLVAYLYANYNFNRSDLVRPNNTNHAANQTSQANATAVASNSTGGN